MRIPRFLPASLCAVVLAGTILAIGHLHRVTSSGSGLCHSILAGAIVLSGMALGLAMECVSESRNADSNCSCCNGRDPSCPDYQSRS